MVLENMTDIFDMVCMQFRIGMYTYVYDEKFRTSFELIHPVEVIKLSNKSFTIPEYTYNKEDLCNTRKLNLHGLDGKIVFIFFDGKYFTR